MIKVGEKVKVNDELTTPPENVPEWAKKFVGRREAGAEGTYGGSYVPNPEFHYINHRCGLTLTALYHQSEFELVG